MVYNRAQQGTIFTTTITTLNIFPPRYFSTVIFPPSCNCDAIFELSQNEASMEFFHRYFSTLFKIKLINNAFSPSWNCNEIWVSDNKYRTSWPFWLGSKGWPLKSQYIAVQPAAAFLSCTYVRDVRSTHFHLIR